MNKPGIKKLISILLNASFILSVLLFLLDELTSFDIINQTFKSSIYTGVLILPIPVIGWNLWNYNKRKLAVSILAMVMFTGTIITGPVKILFASSSWKTQKIIYQNKHQSFRKIEYQTQDIGALGYRRRSVEVLHITPLFIISKPVNPGFEKTENWIKIIPKGIVF